jgi:hypothetical protein
MSVQRHQINTLGQPLDFTSGYMPPNYVQVGQAIANRKAEDRRNLYAETKDEVDSLTKGYAETQVSDQAELQKLILNKAKEEFPAILKKYGYNSPEWQKYKIETANAINSWKKSSNDWAALYPKLIDQSNAPDSYLKKDEFIDLVKKEGAKIDPRTRDLTLGVKANIDPSLVNVPAWIQGELTKSTPMVKSEYATTNAAGDVTTNEVTHPNFGSIDKNGVYKSFVPMEQSEALRMSNRDRAKAYVRSVNKTPEFLEKAGSTFDAEQDEAKAFNLAVNMFAANSHTLKPRISGVKTQLKPAQAGYLLYDTKKKEADLEFESRTKVNEESFKNGDVAHLSAVSGKPYKKDAEGNLSFMEGRKKIKVTKAEFHKLAMQYASKNKGDAEPSSEPTGKNKYDF